MRLGTVIAAWKEYQKGNVTHNPSGKDFFQFNLGKFK
jgi:hypothetical protein